ncbi:MAG: viperin family antiviral radical SAM protein [Bacteroidales bacterium]|nr:viperin family antiviral radical SAM protein [Bacteroidales bacterium]
MKSSNFFKDIGCDLVFNFHMLERCNYSCEYCFAKYGSRSLLSLEDAERVVDKLFKFYENNGIDEKHRRINLAGGEPLLCPYLDELISYISSRGIKVSVITNGSLLTEDRILSWKGKVSMIGISVNSVRQETLGTLGCCDRSDKCLSAKSLCVLAKAIHTSGITLKTDTVVSRLNLDEAEDLNRLFSEMRPERVKLLKMQIVEEVNEKARPLIVSDSEFADFCAEIRCEGAEIVAEGSGDMQNAYLMVDPEGNFYMNDGGKHRKLGNLLEEDMEGVMGRAVKILNPESYLARYEDASPEESGRTEA